jgi:hypothetical protein
MAAHFGTHLWSRGFLKARIAISVSEIYLEQQKTEKICSILRTGKRKGWTIFARTDNPETGAGIIAVFRTDGGMTRCLGSCPDGGGTIPPC